MVVCLVLFGRYMEQYVRRRASRGLTAMRELQAGSRYANRITDKQVGTFE